MRKKIDAGSSEFTWRAGCAVCFLAAVVSAQAVDWLAAPAIEKGLMVYDRIRQRTTVIQPDQRTMGMMTWDLYGDLWVRGTATPTPPARTDFSVVYDSTRRCALLFGGISTTLLNDTWSWDGDRWQQLTPATPPSPRRWAAMAYDEARQRAVLHGGFSTASLFDTWEWDGSNWTPRAVTPSPVVPIAPMAYDVNRGRCVLCGQSGTAFETWEWDGTSWLSLTTFPAPGSRGGHVLWYDHGRQRVGLFGGGFSSHPGTSPLNYNDTWEWDGSSWVMLPTPQVPMGRSRATAAYDLTRQRVVMHGGVKLLPMSQYALSDTWEFDGGTWSLRAPEVKPTWGPMAHDSARQRTVLVAQGNEPQLETWERDSHSWRRRQPVNAPSSRSGTAMAYDRARARVVLFGGDWLADTWEWDGIAWAQRTPVTSPPPLSHHAMTYDTTRQRVVLFGGTAAETWEWDGVVWQLASAATSPPARFLHAMAYDITRQRVVLCGGRDWNGNRLRDTWEWDGSTWTSRGPYGGVNEPVAMTYDQARQVIVLRAGLQDLEWNGTNWSTVTTANSSPAYASSLAYEEGLQRVILHGASTWLFGPVAASAASSTGTGCPGSAGTPILTSSDPFLGNPVFALELLAARPSSPCAFWLSDTSQSLQIGACTLHVGMPLVTSLAITDVVGHATGVDIPIPAVSWLRGLTLHAQAFVLDPLGGGAGLAASPRRTVVCGD